MTGRGRLYVLVNTDLKMSTGKTAAQVAHAVSRLDCHPPKVTIVLQATTEQLHNLDTYLERKHIPHHLYIDEGVNEVPPMSATALAFKAGENTPDFIEDFWLLGEKIPGWLKR